MDYKPLKPEIQLTNHEEKITFKDVWVESQWFINSENCLNSERQKKEGYTIVFEFEKSNDQSFLFTLSPVLNGQIDHSNGGIMDNKKEIRLESLTDTLWLQIHEKNPDKNIGWQEELKGELIGFVKK